jgi:2-aminoethylphosphonate-pyruvate transaminase
MKRTILLNPGPVNISERVRRALLREDICHREDDFSRLMASIRSQLLKAFAPRNFTSVLFSGSGTAALEAAVISSASANQTLLVVTNGVYGERIARIATTYGLTVKTVHAEWTARPRLSDIERLLQEDHSIHVVAVVHHETTTGLINPIQEIGTLAKRHGKLLLVDSISGLGGEPIDLEASGIDLCVGTANKCIQGVPGVSFVLVRQEAMAALEKVPPRSLYLNLHENWQAQERGEPLFTPAIPAFYGFDEALAELLEEGVGARNDRYGRAGALIRQECERLGLTFLLSPELRSRTITAMALPPGFTYPELHDRLKERGFVIYAGQGRLASEIFRVATMGDVSVDEYQEFLKALGEVLSLG